MTNAGREHWDRVYQTKKPTEVSWFRAHLETSLALIAEASPAATAAVLDVGGGESTLVDDLVARGYADVTVLDLSSTALDVTRARLGARAEAVHWICGDVTEVALPEARYDVWHDRAVFHFLTLPSSREAYVKQLTRSLRPGGHVVMGTFGPDGPLECSGLQVVRYDAASLHRALGPHFELEAHREEVHETPLGRAQQFVWCHFRLA